MTKITKLIIAISSLVLLQACDDDDDNTPVNTPTPSEPTTVVDAAVAAGNFTTLVAALQATGLDVTLSDTDGTFTVFAPTDDAFELLGQDTIDALLDDTDTLSGILTYHVLPAQVNAQGAIEAAGTTVATVNGGNIGLSVEDETLLVNTATVTQTDILTDNGVIHVLDAVLMPPTMGEQATMNIVETAVADGRFTTLVTALQTAELDGLLADESATYTVFAPTDDAFAMLGDTLIGDLLDDQEALNAVLLQHVVSGSAVDAVTAFSLNGTDVMTASGATVALAINQDTDTLTVGGANVIITDIPTTNGVIHVIDMVITGDVRLPGQPGNIVETASEVGGFSTLLNLLQTSGLDTVLADSDTSFTVFAPTDEAFALIDDDTLSALAADNDALTNVLLYHVINSGAVLQDAAVSVAQSDTNQVAMANELNAALSLSGSSLYINTSKVSQADVVASNGVIHVVDQVILPPSLRGEPTGSIVDIAVADDNFSTLVEALTAADLVDTLSDNSQTFTVFAPTNNAFDKIDDNVLTALLGDIDGLTGVLLQHVVNGEVSSLSAFSANGSSVDTLANDDVSIEIVNFTDSVDDANAEVAYDAMNQRLVGGMNSAFPGMTIYVFNNDLGTGGSACTGDCAANWPPVVVNDMVPSSIPGLGVIERPDGAMQATYQGRPLYFFAGDNTAGDINGQGVGGVWWLIEQPQVSLRVQGANVVSYDIYATNGVIHVIDTVITETLE